MSFDQTVLRLEGDNICVMQGTPDFVSPEVKFNELCFKCFFHTGLRSLLSQFVESIVLLMRELFICFSHLWSLFSETPLIRWSTTLPSALDQTCGQKASFKWHPVLQYHQQNQHLPQKCVYWSEMQKVIKIAEIHFWPKKIGTKKWPKMTPNDPP